MRVSTKSGTVQYRIGQFTVTIDAEDVRRVKRETWHPTIGAGGAVVFYRNVGEAGKPVFQLLQNFIVDAPLNTPVVFVDPVAFLNLSKSNLRVD
ncbi:MAG TPA: hypothetical protein VME68_04650 [Acidobacteriaceae bacterium]|nr:hypothetical protein [Acidobacteriaceae bacterium]